MPDGETGLVSKFKLLARVLDERARRLVAAAEAESMGFGGVTAVARASGLSRGTVIRGIAELKIAPKAVRGQRIRRKGAGRKRTIDQDASLKRDLESLVEPVTRGDPESSATLDLQERAAIGRRTQAHEAPNQSSHGGGTSA